MGGCRVEGTRGTGVDGELGHRGRVRAAEKHWGEARGSKMPKIKVWRLVPMASWSGPETSVTQHPPNPHHVAMGLFFREGGRAVLQQQLHHVQPCGGAGDRRASDCPGSEFQYLLVHCRQHGGLLT